MATRKSRQSDEAASAGRASTVPEPVRQARRRLLGALVLVLSAVVILPMVLDGEPQPLPDNIPIDIPQRPTLQADEAPRSEAPAAGAAAPVPSEPAAAPAVVTPVVPAAPAQAAQTPVAPPPQPAGDDAARARALLEGTASTGSQPAAPDRAPPSAAPAPPAATTGRFAVQVGAYGTQAAADGVVKRLSAAGIRAGVERIETAGGVRYRVRTNPVQGRAAADQLRARIKEKGLDSTVVPL